MMTRNQKHASRPWAVCVFVAVLFCSGSVLAQEKESLYKRNRHLSFGIRAGFNQLGADFVYRVDKFTIGTSGLGDLYYHAGVFVRKDYKRWFVQPELLYEFNTKHITVVNHNPLPFPYGYNAAGGVFYMSNLVLPVRVGGHLTKWLAVSAGPSVHWHFYENESIDYNHPINQEHRVFKSILDGFNRVSVGLRAGVRFSYKRLSLEMMYENRTLMRRIELNGRTYPFRINSGQYLISGGFVVFRH